MSRANDDLAADTSSASTEQAHGGLRYLERLEFKLIRKVSSSADCVAHDGSFAVSDA